MVLRLLALALGTTTIKLSDAVAVLVAAVAFAPAGASALQDRAEDVRASQARRFQAMVSNDVEAVASYLADDLHAHGRRHGDKNAVPRDAANRAPSIRGHRADRRRSSGV